MIERDFIEIKLPTALMKPIEAVDKNPFIINVIKHKRDDM